MTSRHCHQPQAHSCGNHDGKGKYSGEGSQQLAVLLQGVALWDLVPQVSCKIAEYNLNREFNNCSSGPILRLNGKTTIGLRLHELSPTCTYSDQAFIDTFILIIFSLLCIVVTSGLFFRGFPTKILYLFIILTCILFFFHLAASLSC